MAIKGEENSNFEFFLRSLAPKKVTDTKIGIRKN